MRTCAALLLSGVNPPMPLAAAIRTVWGSVDRSDASRTRVLACGSFASSLTAVTRSASDVDFMAVLNASSASSTALSSWPPTARPSNSTADIISKAPLIPILLVPSSSEIGTRRRDFPAVDSALFLSCRARGTYLSTERRGDDETLRGDRGADPGGMRGRGGVEARAQARTQTGGESRAEDGCAPRTDARQAGGSGARARPGGPRPRVLRGDPDGRDPEPGRRRKARL